MNRNTSATLAATMSGGDSSYYDRTAVRGFDGVPIFKTEEDAANEKAVAEAIARIRGCTLRSAGRYSLYDWTILRDGRQIGWAELKCRSHPSTQYPTVFLNVRKYVVLWFLNVVYPAFFFVRFSDGIFWIRVDAIDPHQNEIGGCKRIVKSRNDIEPVIHVPVARMRRLAEDPEP